MPDDRTFRVLLLIGIAGVFPITAYHRIKAHINEPLDRRQEGWTVLATVCADHPFDIADCGQLVPDGDRRRRTHDAGRPHDDRGSEAGGAVRRRLPALYVVHESFRASPLAAAAAMN